MGIFPRETSTIRVGILNFILVVSVFPLAGCWGQLKNGWGLCVDIKEFGSFHRVWQEFSLLNSPPEVIWLQGQEQPLSLGIKVHLFSKRGVRGGAVYT